MSNKTSSLDKELGIPKEATSLPSSSSNISSGKVAILKTSGGVEIKIASETCLSPAAGRRSVLVGRQSSTADIRIQHGSISRKHAVFYYIKDAIYLKDLGGKHGTTVNGERLKENCPVALSDSDCVLFGNVRESIFQVVLQQQLTTDIVETAGRGLTGRAKREAEIQAVAASLEEAPSYQSHSSSAAKSEHDSLDPILKIAKKHKLPVTHRFKIAAESERRHANTCLAVDPAGARFVVGGSNGRLRFFDFGGMDQNRHDSFKTAVPDEGYGLVSVAYSNTGDRVLVGTGSVQPVVLHRDGDEVIKFVRGDMYVTDQAKTAGHTAAVTAVDWHPLERDKVLTASSDGSARLWNLNGKTQFKMLVCDKVFSVKNMKGQRTVVTCACFHPGGREFAVGTACGSIRVWNRTRTSSRPERAVFDAHEKNKPVHALTYNLDGSKLASRSAEDDTVKVWNTKRMSKSSSPNVTCQQLPAVHERANAAFSPDGTMICAGSSGYEITRNQQQHKVGRLSFYNIPGSENDACVESSFVNPTLSIEMDNENSSPVVVKWHSRINQVLVGCSDGGVIVFYDPQLSSKGAVLSASKISRGEDDLSTLLRSRAPQGSAAISGEIVAPFSLPMYRKNEVSERKRKREERKDPVTSREPERPATGKHKTGGQTGGNLSFTQFVVDQTTAKTKAIAGKDPREALLQYNEGKTYIARAYEGNQERILAEKTMEEEEDEINSKR